MIDDLDALRARDAGGFLLRLAALPGSYDGPDGRREGPYGLLGFGEAGNLPELLEAWVDAPVVASGTQFVLAGGFDFGDAATLRVSSELAGASVIVLGDGAFDPSYGIPHGVLSTYSYVRYLAFATGHQAAGERADARMRELLPHLVPETATEANPAKTLAWALWNRVPLLVSSRGQSALQGLVQQVFARVGKTLAVTTGAHPTAVASGALEARHALGDDLVGLVLGRADRETGLVREVLGTRVAQVESLTGAFEGRHAGLLDGLDDVVAEGLVVWYVALWVAAYGGLLHDLDPGVSDVYERVRNAADAPA